MYNIVLLDNKGLANRVVTHDADLSVLLQEVPSDYDESRYTPVINRFPKWSAEPAKVEEGLFIWKNTEWQPQSSLAVDLSHPRFTPPKEIYVCRDWTTEDRTYPSWVLAKVEECVGCPDEHDCDGPVRYAKMKSDRPRVHPFPPKESN